MIINKETAMALFDNYKKNKNITTHQPFPMGAGGVMKFWTKNLAFVYQGPEGYLVTVKPKGNQSALVELSKYLGKEAD